MGKAANFELSGFSPQGLIFPLASKPRPLPDEPPPPLSRPRLYFQEEVPQEIVDSVLEPFNDVLNDRHRAALGLAVRYHQGRLAFKRAFSIAAMGAADIEEFSPYFERLTGRGVHLPFKPPKKHVSRNTLKEAYPPAFTLLSMEQGAVAVSAYFSYFKPEFCDQAAKYLAHRLRRAAVKQGNKPTIVDPHFTDTKEFVEVVLDKENNSREQYIKFARALHKRLSTPC